MNFYIILSLLLFILSFLLTFLSRKIALRRNVIDVPNERSSHEQPTPRGGGIAIVISWFTGIILLYFNHLISNGLFYAFLSGLLLAFISLLDDIYSIRPSYRLLFQLFSTALAVYFLGGIELPLLSNYPVWLRLMISMVLVLGGIWFINLYNFLDGTDGYASLEAIFVSLGLMVFSGSEISLILIAATTGFLCWNWPKAKIFMGDVGSTQLGFVLFVLGVYFHNKGSMDISIWIMLTSLFWFDATFTLYRRWRNKEKLSEAHNKHAYQRIVQYGFSHRRVLFVLVLVNTIIFIMILLYREFNFLKFPLTLITIFGLFLLYKMVDKRVPFK